MGPTIGKAFTRPRGTLPNACCATCNSHPRIQRRWNPERQAKPQCARNQNGSRSNTKDRIPDEYPGRKPRRRYTAEVPTLVSPDGRLCGSAETVRDRGFRLRTTWWPFGHPGRKRALTPETRNSIASRRFSVFATTQDLSREIQRSSSGRRHRMVPW
jgi:hypothetical protein